MPDAVVNKGNQTLGDAGLGHDVAGEHKEGNRQEQELCHAGEEVCRDNGHFVPRIKHGQNGGQAQADRNGGVQKQENEEGTE